MDKEQGIEGRNPAIGFIGAGILGAGLALALARRGYRVVAVSSRRRASAETLAAKIPGCRSIESAQGVADAADLVFITTPDGAIGAVAAGLRWRPGQQAVHCCGAAGRGLLRPAEEQGADTGAFHPLQTFAGLTDPEDTVARLAGVTFAISAEGGLREFLESAARRLGGQAASISDDDRPLYHAAAVLACGYLSALLQGAVELWRTLGYSEEQALAALLPLSRATLETAAGEGIGKSVTGPLVRGDTATVEAHLEALAGRQPELCRLYLALTEASLPLAVKAGIGPAEEAALRRLLRQYGPATSADRRLEQCPE